MRFLILVGDGMADFPCPELDGRTPLDVAATPAMDSAVSQGLTGLFSPIPDGLPPGSDIGNLSLFGYDPRATFTGRAPLEAASRGIRLVPGEVAFRCNLVTLADGVMRSFTSGHITSEEGARLIEALGEAFAGGPARFHAGVSYRHLTIITPGDVTAEDLVATQCTPPHDISDRAYEPHLPSGPAGAFLGALMEGSREVLAGHAVNEARIDAGDLPATSIWLWGQGSAPKMETYGNRFNLTGAVISAVDLVKGIGVCAGLDAVDVPGATGYLDTNYQGKVDAAFDALAGKDFVYLHVEAPDETAHEGRPDLKIRAIEDFDRRVVAPCLERAAALGDVRVLIAPDHVTSLATKTHAGGPVPFALCGPGIAADEATAYSESAAAATGLHVACGHCLVPAMITQPRLDAARLISAPG
ncbi:MAG: cofactor-independent phosphoglycerate mutase [Candidatus Hydrogenedentes bacterium]|nr:cofactor-independent phosphoglycerate mutase [Candidatus Hydrogenedentota bacterium]